jgi:hypothetical protein
MASDIERLQEAIEILVSIGAKRVHINLSECPDDTIPEAMARMENGNHSEYLSGGSVERYRQIKGSAGYQHAGGDTFLFLDSSGPKKPEPNI